MKQIRLLTIAIFLIATTSHAQINKGANALGGSISVNSASLENDNSSKQTSSNFSIAPSFMTVYKDNRAVGFELSYFHSSNDAATEKGNGYSAIIFLRQYKPLGKGFYVFAHEGLYFAYDKSWDYSADSSIKTNNKIYSTGLTANPGIAYDVCKKVQLELLLFNNLFSAGYTHATSSYASSTTKSNGFNVNVNLDASSLTSLNIGAKIFFGR